MEKRSVFYIFAILTEQISLNHLVFQSGRLTLERGLALHATKGWADAGVAHNGLNNSLVLTREADGRYDFLCRCRLGHDGRATVAYILCQLEELGH